MSGPYQGRDLSNCGVGRLRVAINCGVLSVKDSYNNIIFGCEPSVCSNSYIKLLTNHFFVPGKHDSECNKFSLNIFSL